jgi:hypothetical protein
MNCRINRPVPYLRARRVFTEEVVALPVLRRPDGSRNKSATAIGAHVLQDAIDARDAERAFVGADARLERVGRQRLVAVLAGRSEFKHQTAEVLAPTDSTT